MKTILIVVLLLICSCSKSDVIMQNEIITKSQDTTTYRFKPPKPKDTTDRHPIRFDVHITDWKEYFN